jgi:hypothetical protein
MGRAFSPSPDRCGWRGFPGPLAQAGMVRAVGAEAEDKWVLSFASGGFVRSDELELESHKAFAFDVTVSHYLELFHKS